MFPTYSEHLFFDVLIKNLPLGNLPVEHTWDPIKLMNGN